MIVRRLINRVVDGGDADAEVLQFADRTQMTLHLAGPATAIAERAAKNCRRWEKLWAAYDEVLAALRGVDFVFLKGATHGIGFGIDLARRVQYDLDLYCPPEEARRAVEALGRIGYGPHRQETWSDQHLPVLVKPFTFEWSGDYFDPEIPISIDVHTTLWNDETDRLPAAATAMWGRRTVIEVGGRRMPALAERDRITYAALHALRHLLRHDTKIAHVHELGRMMDRAVSPPDDPRLARLEAVAFRFASEWFGFSMPPAEDLPAAAAHWFERSALSPAESVETPNKDVLWLHLALVDSTADKWRVLARQLFPLRRPRAGSAASRVLHHARSLPRTLAAGWRFAKDSIASHTSD